jgi:hypothetical protein
MTCPVLASYQRRFSSSVTAPSWTRRLPAPRRADDKIECLINNRDVYAIAETLARTDKKSVAAVREIDEQLSKLV